MSFPISQARAELWKWTRQPADALLIEDPDLIAKTGVRDDARVLTDPAARVHFTPAPAAVNGLFVPAMLPIPPAAMVILPSGEPPEVAAARLLVVDWLREARAVAAELHTDQASLDDEMHASRKLDKLITPAIVAALNHRHQGLRLIYAHNVDPAEHRRIADPAAFGSSAWHDVVRNPPEGRSRILIDTEFHSLALDVMVSLETGSGKKRASVIALHARDASKPEDQIIELAGIAAELKLPRDWSLLVVPLPVQRSKRSCRIFALSMALKAHRDTMLEPVHQARLQGQGANLKLEDIFDFTSMHAATPQVLGQEVFPAAQIAGPQYMKHAHSRSDVRRYIKMRGADAQDPVNRRHKQTLLQRHDAHRVLRKTPSGSENVPKIYSASIELKRIRFIDQAIKYAATCDRNEVLRLAQSMQAVNERWIDTYRP